MGNYLSFPLLCISNISTLFCGLGSEVAWGLIRKRLVVVNGDDLVFKASRSQIEQWRRFLKFSGFVMNESKTSVHSRLFTLNSKCFSCGKKRVRKVWHLVPKGVFKKTDTSKHSDMMAAHAAVVRENVRGCPGNEKGRVTRALASVKKSAYKFTSVKTLCAVEEAEYRRWPGQWKLAERIKEWERRYSPLKESFEGVKLMKVRREDATAQQIAESPYVAARARFSFSMRERVKESNDRRLSPWDVGKALDFLCQAYPDYRKGREDFVWVDEPPGEGRDLEFIKFS